MFPYPTFAFPPLFLEKVPSEACCHGYNVRCIAGICSSSSTDSFPSEGSSFASSPPSFTCLGFLAFGICPPPFLSPPRYTFECADAFYFPNFTREIHLVFIFSASIRSFMPFLSGAQQNIMSLLLRSHRLSSFVTSHPDFPLCPLSFWYPFYLAPGLVFPPLF